MAARKTTKKATPQSTTKAPSAPKKAPAQSTQGARSTTKKAAPSSATKVRAATKETAPARVTRTTKKTTPAAAKTTPKSAKSRPSAPKKPAATRAAGAPPATADVAAFLEGLDHPRKQEILALRKIISGVDRKIREDIKWNAPSFFTSEHFATFHLRAKDGVQLVLHLGAKPRTDAPLRSSIADPDRLLTWRGEDRATITFRDLADVTAKKDALRAILRQWLTFL